MKIRRLFSLLSAAILSAVLLTGCKEKVPENTIHSIADLSGKAIGVQAGTTGDIYASDITDNVEIFNSGKEAVKSLKEGKLDAVLIDIEPAKLYVEQNPELTILEESFTVEEYAIAVKKGNNELLDKINGALDELIADGTLEAIKSNWIGDEAGQHPYVSPEGTERINGTLVMATNADFAPYESRDGDNIVGFDVDMMQAVCDKLGMNLNIRNMDFDNVLIAVDSAKADVGVAGITVTPERENIVSFSNTYTTSTQVIIIRKD